MNEMIKPKLGRPFCDPTLSDVENLLHWSGKDLLISNAARCARIHPYIVERWMKQGGEDVLEGNDTVCAQLFIDLRQKQGLKVSELLSKIDSCCKNWQAIAWRLEKCFAEDFGRESEIYKELLDQFKKLLQDRERNLEKPIEGYVDHG